MEDEEATYFSYLSAEAEYRSMVVSMVVTLYELKWLYRLLQDFRVSIPRSIPLHSDNQATLHISANPVFYEHTKHIEIDCHLVCDVFYSRFLSPHYIHSSLQPVDILTKALPPSSFHFLLLKLGICDLHAPT